MSKNLFSLCHYGVLCVDSWAKRFYLINFRISEWVWILSECTVYAICMSFSDSIFFFSSGSTMVICNWCVINHFSLKSAIKHSSVSTVKSPECHMAHSTLCLPLQPIKMAAILIWAPIKNLLDVLNFLHFLNSFGFGWSRLILCLGLKQLMVICYLWMFR